MLLGLKQNVKKATRWSLNGLTVAPNQFKHEALRLKTWTGIWRLNEPCKSQKVGPGTRLTTFCMRSQQQRVVLVRALLTQLRRCGSIRWRTAMSPDLPREGRSKVTEPLSPALFICRLTTWKEKLQLPLPSLPWSIMRDGLCTDRDEPEVEWRAAECAGLTRRMLSQQVHWITKVASTGKGTAALGFNGGLRGHLFRQDEIRGASFVPHHSGVEETVSPVWGKVEFILYLTKTSCACGQRENFNLFLDEKVEIDHFCPF